MPADRAGDRVEAARRCLGRAGLLNSNDSLDHNYKTLFRTFRNPFWGNLSVTRITRCFPHTHEINHD